MNTEYSMSEFKYHGCFLNPDKLPEKDRQPYIDALNKFFEAFRDIIRIHIDNEDISKKAFEEVFGKSKKEYVKEKANW